jgi:catechol 2,3-dioxygenase-like lactoylglutathione lyase family enzyme
MSRVQLALNVSDLEGAVTFYSTLFGVEPAKRRPGYANFAVAEPPLKLVLMEDATARGAGVRGALNHLGVEVESSDLVAAARQRLSGEGLATATQDHTTCCYAVQDKVWVHDPDQVPWEVYTVLANTAPAAGGADDPDVPARGCCTPSAQADAAAHDGRQPDSAACC